MRERIRETVWGSLDQDEMQSRIAQGWRLVAVEWERAQADVETTASEPLAEVPFGLRVSSDCAHLEEDPGERATLIAMMELTIEDGPYSSIADELNRRGFRTREGHRWTPVSVFQMLPRLIETGPKIFNSEEWKKRRPTIRSAAT